MGRVRSGALIAVAIRWNRAGRRSTPSPPRRAHNTGSHWAWVCEPWSLTAETASAAVALSSEARSRNRARGWSTLVTLPRCDSVGDCLLRGAWVLFACSISFIFLACSGSSARGGIPRIGTPMAKRMIWVEDEHFTGWCCSRCPWGVIAPCLESTVAALAFNRVAQDGFEKHECAGSADGEAQF